jgi:hypothetical protein
MTINNNFKGIAETMIATDFDSIYQLIENKKDTEEIKEAILRNNEDLNVLNEFYNYNFSLIIEDLNVIKENISEFDESFWNNPEEFSNNLLKEFSLDIYFSEILENNINYSNIYNAMKTSVSEDWENFYQSCRRMEEEEIGSDLEILLENAKSTFADNEKVNWQQLFSEISEHNLDFYCACKEEAQIIKQELIELQSLSPEEAFATFEDFIVNLF